MISPSEFLKECFEAEKMLLEKPTEFCHYHETYVCTKNSLPKLCTSSLPSYKIINTITFSYTNNKLDEFEDSYWFCLGTTKDGKYFMYESDCCGSGFGLGSKSKMYIAIKMEYILLYALTDRHRHIIDVNST